MTCEIVIRRSVLKENRWDALTKWRKDDDKTNWVQEECCSVQKWKNYSGILNFCQKCWRCAHIYN
jgi:hypothetical protein